MSKNNGKGKGLNIELHPGLINPRLLLKRGNNNNPYLADSEVKPVSRKRQKIGQFYRKGDISGPLDLQRRRWREKISKIERGDLPNPFVGEDKYFLKSEDIPDVEWWDKKYYLPERVTDDSEEGEEENDDDDEEEDMYCPSIKYVLHPVPPKISNSNSDRSDMPFIKARLYLTSRERKKLRRNKRKLQQEEKEQKIKLGLLPKPTNKIKMSTMMNQEGKGIDLPTGWEREVKEAMIERKREHDLMNQRRHELAIKIQQDRRMSGNVDNGGNVIWVKVYRFRQLINPSIRYKLSMNSKQLGLRGLCLRNREDGPGIIIIMSEREKTIRFMNRLIMERLPWRQSFSMKSYYSQKDEDDRKMIDMSNNEIKLVCSGQINKGEYEKFPRKWFMKVCQNEEEIKQILSRFEAEHYYYYQY